MLVSLSTARLIRALGATILGEYAMPDYLMYWKYFWQDIEGDPDSFNDRWHTRNESFFDQVRLGDSLWVVVSGGLNYPDEWRLLQRIVVQEKFVNHNFE